MNDSIKKQCLIVIDSGFSAESMRGAKVLAARDLARGTTFVGTPFLSASDLDTFACDPLNHGSIVLEHLRGGVPDVALILLRVFGEENKCIRTEWEGGRITSDGWTEAYLWAVELCDTLGYTSVTNCSFGGIVHAADGSGWEAHQLSKVTGVGKAGHIVVAAAGPGDGRAIHASWSALPSEPVWVNARQTETTSYNFWLGSSHQQWYLNIHMGANVVATHCGADLPANIWNGRQQLMFEVAGDGDISFEFTLGASCEKAIRCDAWVRGQDSARFGDHVDARLIAEPAVFCEVIAVGLGCKSYAPDQNTSGSKPEVLLAGSGEVSFRTPEVTCEVLRMLGDNSALDVSDVRKMLSVTHGKN